MIGRFLSPVVQSATPGTCLPRKVIDCLRHDRIGWVTATAAALVCVSCSRHEPPSEPPMPENVVALVGETPITELALQAELKKQGRADPQAALERLIRRELLLAEVKRTGFSDSAEIQEAWSDLIISRFLESQRLHLEKRPPPDASELDEYYQAHREDYSKPERRRVALIFLRGKGTDSDHLAWLATNALSIRNQAVAEASRNPDFGALATKHSDHRPSRNQGGDVGWIVAPGATGAWPAEVMAGIRDLGKVGEISPVIFSGQGCYLLKLIAWRPPESAPLEQVRERVAADLIRKRARQDEMKFYAQIRSRFPVVVRSKRLEGATPPVQLMTDARPPRLPSP